MAKPAPLLALDMTDYEKGERQTALATLCDRIVALLEERYRAADGFQHKEMVFAPFQEWPKVIGRHRIARRGLMEGFLVTVSPADFECKKIHVYVRAWDYLTEEVLALVGIVGGVIALVATAYYAFVVQDAPFRGGVLVVLMAAGLLGGGAFWGIAYALSRPFMPRTPEKQGELRALQGEVRERLIGKPKGGG